MEPTEVTIQVLREIRDEVTQTREEVKQTNALLDETNIRLSESRVARRTPRSAGGGSSRSPPPSATCATSSTRTGSFARASTITSGASVRSRRDEIFHAGGGSPQATSSLASAPDDLSSSASSFILARSRTRCGSIVNRWAFAMAAPSGPGATGDPRAASVRRRGIHDPTDEEHGLRQYVPHEEEERPVHVHGLR